jgi:hypothetical protein
MLRRLAAGLLLRRLTRELTRVALALDQQTALLARLVDRIAPVDPPANRPVVEQDTGVTFLDSVDMGLALDYIEKTQRDTGHVPDEDEILVHLADEKTQNLHQRLVERDAQLERLAAERRW